MLLVISVCPTCGHFDLYHVFRLHVFVCVYKISLETVDFLTQINPVCSYCKVFICVCVCVCVCVCGSALLVLKRQAVLTCFVCCVVQY
jgi:hypothetical protein